MIPKYRQAFNRQYSNERYARYQQAVQDAFDYPPHFRLLETPVFLPKDLVQQLKSASISIIEQLKKSSFRSQTHHAIPDHQLVPNEDEHPLFLQFDFAITRSSNGQLRPQLIELQGFPALFFFQLAASDGFRSVYDFDGFTGYYGGFDRQAYIQALQENILGNHHPEQVILLEFDPWHQKTAIDFAGARQVLKIPVVDIRHLHRVGRQLFYRNQHHQSIPIRRIFNRVILDEIAHHPHQDWAFDLTQDVDVEWAGHPNWFLKYSKFALPFIEGDFVPKSIFLDQWHGDKALLSRSVLKPIFSFSGQGVTIQPTQKIIDKIQNKQQYILQEKIDYAPILPSPGQQLSQVEVRVMLIQNPHKTGEYLFMTNLVRAGKGGIIGTQYQQNDQWIGGGIALMES